MPLPLGKPEKVKAIRRAKAPSELLLPCLALAAVILVSTGFRQARQAPVTEKANGETQTKQDGWLFANAASSSDASIETTQGTEGTPGKGAGKNPGATTVTTYTAFGTF